MYNVYYINYTITNYNNHIFYTIFICMIINYYNVLIINM